MRAARSERFLLITLVSMVACQSGDSRSSSATPNSAIHALLISELREKARRSDISDTVRDDEVEFRPAVPSAILPQVDYHWATYHSQRLSHGSASAVAGRSQTMARIIRTADDWAMLRGSWRAASPDQAEAACVELASLLLYGGPLPRSVRVSAADTSDLDPSEVKRLRRLLGKDSLPSIVLDADSSWLVSEWLVHPTRRTIANRIACRVNARSSGPAPTVAKGDSIAWRTIGLD